MHQVFSLDQIVAEICNLCSFMILDAQAKRLSICGFEMEKISLKNAAEGLLVCNFGNGEEKERECLSEHFSSLCSVFLIYILVPN